MRKPKHKMPVTIAVVAYFGGETLMRTIDSILATAPKSVPLSLFVYPNGVLLDSDTREYLKNFNVTIVPNKVEKGLTYRIKQAIAQCGDEFLLITQDGIGFTPTTIENTLTAFKDPEVTLTSAKIEPSHGQTLPESITEVRALLKWRIGNSWRRKDNYLMASTKCLGLRVSAIRELAIPDSVNNVGTYLYLANKQQKWKFKYVFNAVCTNKRPQSIYKYIDWRKNLLSTQDDMYKHLDLRPREFSIPKFIVTEAIFLEIVNRPIPTTLYFLMLSYIKAKQYTHVAAGSRIISSINTQFGVIKTLGKRAFVIPRKRSRIPARSFRLRA